MDFARTLQSPEPMADDNSHQDPLSRAPEHGPDQRRGSGQRRPRLSGMTMEQRLQMMPELRPLPWRPGVEMGSELETGGESRRKQIRFGCLLATRGQVQPVPCNTCANGRGKFRLCVALDGFFKGACASCQLSGRPNRCSIKKGDDTDDGKSPTSEASPRFTATYTLPPPPEAHYTNGPPPPKRRRTQQSRELPDQEPKSEEDRRPVIRDMTERHWATVNSPMPAPPSQIPSQMSMETPPNSRYNPPPPPPPDRDRPVGWAAVNQAPPMPIPPPPSQPLNGRDEQNGSFSQLPSYESEKQEGTVGNEEASISLIDSLPKSKQRQIYGVLGGLQSGIDHLQRELDSLKRTFGINDD